MTAALVLAATFAGLLAVGGVAAHTVRWVAYAALAAAHDRGWWS